MSDTQIITRKIKLHLLEEDKKIQKDVYKYLIEAIWAQNQAFNRLLTETYYAKNKNKSKEYIDNIYFQYSHQSPDYCVESEKFLYELKKLIPITKEKIEEKVEEYRIWELSKKKPPKEDALKKKCETMYKKYEKYIGKDKEDIQKLIDRYENYCAYPSEVYEKFANGFSTPAYVMQQVKGYWSSFESEVLNGEASLRTMKTNKNPLIIPPNLFYGKDGSLIGLTYEYDSYQEFLDNLTDAREIKLNLELPYKKGSPKIKFRLVLGNPHKSAEIRNVIQNIFEERYKIKGSKIGFTINKKTGENNIPTLFLSIEIPVKEVELDENITVGVDLGQAIPAVCALNINHYARAYFGERNDLKNTRTKIQNQRRRVQKSLAYTSSNGHGRKKKLNKLEVLEKREKNYVTNYLHKISSDVIKFALQYRAKYINLENLSGYNTSKMILRNWSYYQLQQYIVYKANKVGIIVRFINPAYTSQVCSYCGHWEPNQRKTQKDFVCGNPECQSHKLKYINADFNGARNIAMSTLWDESSKKEKKLNTKLKEARKYYSIPEPSNDAVDFDAE